MKKALIIFVALLIAPAVVAETMASIANAESVTIDTKITSTIDVSGSGRLDYLNAQLFFYPKKSYNQDIISLDTDPAAVEGDDVIVFEWKEISPQKVNYGAFSTVTVKNDFPKVTKKITYPISVPDHLVSYLQPTEVIDSGHSLVIEQATRLAEGEDDLFVLVATIAAWTKNTISYNLSTLTADVSQPASWVLENQKGVCDELTSLFIAMLRALGIPSRFISGLSFTNSPLFPNQWGAHGWAEVWFPEVGWLPFDPTFGEYGWIDPGHIKMLESLDPKEPSSKFEWKGSKVTIDPKPLDLTGEITDKGARIAPLITLSASGAKDDVGIGTYNLAILNVTNLQDHYIATEIVMAEVEELDILDPTKKQVVLRPHETKQLTWMVKVHDDLKKNYRYEIPLGYFTVRNESTIGYFTVEDTGPTYSNYDIKKLQESIDTVEEKAATTGLLMACTPALTEFYENQENTITCTLKNRGTTALTDLQVCFEETCKSATLLLNQQAELSFALPYYKPGDWDYRITAATDAITQDDTIQVRMLDAPAIDIIELVYPNKVKYKDTFDVAFAIEKTSISTPQNVQVALSTTTALQEFTLDELTATQEFEITVDGTRLRKGENQLTITVQYEDTLSNQYVTTEPLLITLEKLSFFQNIGYFFNRIGQSLFG